MDVCTLQTHLSKYTNTVNGSELASFHTKSEFKRENILFLKTEEYALGLGNSEVFCNWMENKLKSYGSMKGGNSVIFGIWYGTRNKGTAPTGYQCVKKYEHTPINIDKSFQIIRKDLYDLLIAGEYEDYDKIDRNKLSNVFKAKILSVYYPDKYLCIFAHEHLINIKNLLEIELSDEDSIWEIKKSIANWRIEHMPRLNIWSFMRALYAEFNALIYGAYVPPQKKLILCDIDYISTIPPISTTTISRGMPNYQDKQARQSKVGQIGEEKVLDYERDKLKGYHKQPVNYGADLTKHFDILSYDMNTGNEIHIEVKTKVKFKNNLDFYITDYEKWKLENDPDYAIYYVTDINTKPKLFILDILKMQGISPEIKLIPTIFRVQHAVKIKP